MAIYKRRNDSHYNAYFTKYEYFTWLSTMPEYMDFFFYIQLGNKKYLASCNINDFLPINSCPDHPINIEHLNGGYSLQTFIDSGFECVAFGDFDSVLRKLEDAH